MPSDTSINPKDKAKPPPPPPPRKPKSLSSQQQSAPSPSASRSKRGLGWPWDSSASQFKLYAPYYTSGRISWVFNWETWVPESLPVQVEWIPCVRTAGNAKDVDAFLTDILLNRGLKAEALLGFNEPEISEQANLSVETAVDLWRRIILPAKNKFGLRLGSPGMSSDVGRSKPWLSSFLAQLGAGEHGIDFLVVHWYGPRFADMRAFLEDMHATYGLPLWVNEFACSTMGDGEASHEEVEEFLNEAIPWLDQCDWVERYAYFGNAQGKDVGTWVGRQSNFTEVAEGADETAGMRLSRIGRHYCEL
jgi:hypothetical protein